MLTHTKLVQALIGTGLIIGMNAAMAGLWLDQDMQTAVTKDESNHYTTEGDAWLNGHTYFSPTNSVVTIGGSLYKTGEEGKAKLQLNNDTSVSISQDVDLDTLTNGGHLEIGGSITVGTLEQHGTLTGINGAALGKVVAGSFYTSVGGVYNDLTVTGTLNNTGADLTLTGEIGTAEKGAVVTTNGGSIVVNGAVHSYRIDMQNGNIAINDGPLELTGGWFMVTGTGNEVLQAQEVIVKGNGTVYGSELKADVLTVDGTEGNRLFTVSYSNDETLTNPGKLNVNTLVLEGDANFQHHDRENPLEVNKVVLKTTSSNYFQTYGGMKIGSMEVEGDARVDGYAKTTGEMYDIPIEIGNAWVKEKASLTFSNTVGTGQSDATIGTLILEDGASLANAAYKSDGSTLRPGYHLAVDNLQAENAVITTLDGTTTLGANDGTVQMSGTVNDSNEGQTVLNLNNAEARWIATGASAFDSLVTKGGTTDISQTTDDVSVKNLSGSGTVVLDAGGTNKLVVGSTAEDTQIVVQASETADDVTLEEASAMVGRLEGVKEADKSGFVEEGMYNGAITTDGAGNTTVRANSLMSDALEVASASTLSLNRILMNDVRKRLGNLRTSEGNEGAWARYDGGRLSGEGTKTKFHTIQVGGDTLLSAAPVRLGFSASYTTGDADVTRGDADIDAWSLAAYGLWFADNGAFADVVARIGRADADLTIDGIHKGSLENTAYSLSGEFGWHFDFGSGFYAEPQVEATYTRINSDTLNLTGSGTTYAYKVDSLDSMIGRVGGLVGLKCPNGMGDVYARASLVHEFLGDASITGGNASALETDGKDTWVEYGVGVNVNLTPATYLWLDLERTSGAHVDEDVRATVGIRHAF